jgi:N-sulfoglucosamine sulfohydrolase
MKYTNLLLSLSLITAGGKSTAQAPLDKPNILWIVSEDNDPFLGCYGDTYATTPNIDAFAKQGILYRNAFSAAPVCAPSRSALITGMYPTTLGTEHMRSNYPVPGFVRFFPAYLKEAGYYTTNNSKKDYNTVDQPQVWDESSDKATYKNRKPGQPFFAVFNIFVSHESNIFGEQTNLIHDPAKAPVPPYHPRTAAFEHDWALYYDKIQEMDRQVGKILKELDEAGLADNTIVFYYSDNGGVLPRSKRFINEAGLHVPLIVRFPEKYKSLASQKAGSETNKLVSFVDFAPTVLSLAGIPVPAYFQGHAFLGKQIGVPNAFTFGFRGRMDERYDLVRSIRTQRFRYVRNYLPQKIYGQHVDFLWKAQSMRSWEQEYKAGKLNEVQSVFWKAKPAEELYDITADPLNIRNLASDPVYRDTLVKLRNLQYKFLLETKDAGFIPEPLMAEIAKSTTIYDFVRSADYPLERILQTADWATSYDAGKLSELVNRFADPNPIVRYWAAIGASVLADKAVSAREKLLTLLNDQDSTVRIAAAEALYRQGYKTGLVPLLNEILKSPNDKLRLFAINLLDDMGEDATEAIPDIEYLLKTYKSEYETRIGEYILSKHKKIYPN